MSKTYAFPQDLLDAQAALDETRTQCDAYARTLPSFRSGKADSPGYTPEQAAEVARFRARLLELSITVSTHSFWDTLDRGDVVQARMALKHAHDQPADDAGAGV
ncbi:hypothetical protein LRE75_34365 [Streptomyces sp. 372A]